MTIDALPTPPNRNMTPEAFIAAADAFVAALSNMVTQVNADLNLILNLSGLLATSTTSVTIGTGSKSFTVETSKAYLAGQSVRVYSTASPANYMLGTVTSYDAGTGALVVNVTSVGGSGTLAAWTVVLAASGEWLGNATTATSAGSATTATSAGDLTGTPTFFSPLSNSLSADVTISNTTSYFDGPAVAQGTSGKWIAFGQVELYLPLGAGSNVLVDVKLWDGATVIASTRQYLNNYLTNQMASFPISGYIDTPAGNIRISVKCGDTGTIRANTSGNGKDSTLTVIRVG